MKNSEAINTFNVLSQLNDEKGLPIKFSYGLVKLLGRLKKVTEVLQAVQNKQLEGQAEYDTERTKLLIDSSDKDKAGSPIIVDNNRGSNYKITNMVKFNKQIEKLNKKYKELLDAIKIRDT